MPPLAPLGGGSWPHLWQAGQDWDAVSILLTFVHLPEPKRRASSSLHEPEPICLCLLT